MVALTLGSPLPRVVVVGGTHGNEYTGMYVVEHVLSESELRTTFPALSIDTLCANPRAYAVNRRFVDDDLNRQFTSVRLGSAPDASVYESVRAHGINAELGPKGPTASADFVIDMHTTTANMGCTIIVNSYSTLAVRVAAYLSKVWGTYDAELPPTSHAFHVYLHDVSQDDAPYLCSVGRDGITIEVGPTPQGLVRADCVATTERALCLILRYLNLHYSVSEQAPPIRRTLPLYVDQGKVPWPAVTGSSAVPGVLIAPSLQDSDFEPLRTGDAMWVRPDGSESMEDRYDGALGEVVYPIFVNEAAYYYAQSGRGVGLTKLVDWPVE